MNATMKANYLKGYEGQATPKNKSLKTSPMKAKQAKLKKAEKKKAQKKHVEDIGLIPTIQSPCHDPIVQLAKIEKHAAKVLFRLGHQGVLQDTSTNITMEAVMYIDHSHDRN